MANNDPFVALTECHMFGDITESGYFPDFERWWQSVEGVVRVWTGRSILEGGFPPPHAEELIKWMDEAEVDVCFALRESMMDVFGGSTPMSTNGFIIKEIAPYPDRMYLECNVGPILKRGVKHAIWELEYLVKEQNAKLCKVYACEDGPLNHPDMWPFYAKASELDIPLTIHLGMAYVMPQPTKYTLPILLDDVLIDFPDLKIIGYHMGWPYHEELFGLAAKHKNLYLSVSGVIGWLERAPHKAYHMIGEALDWVGPEKIVMGLDLPFNDMKRITDFIRTFDIPEELRQQWGYPKITQEIRNNMLGLTLAKLAKIEPKKRVKKAGSASAGG